MKQMRKILAIVLSFAMVLSLTAGFFTVSSGADETPYAEQQAEALWANATKAKNMKMTFGSAEAFVIENNTSELDLATARPDLFAGGTLSFSDGVLTLKNVAYAATQTATPLIQADGALNVDFTGANLKATINLSGGYTTVPNQHIIITSSDGSDLVTTVANTMRTSTGAIVTYGPMGIDIKTSAHDNIITSTIDKTTAMYPMILGNTGGTVLHSASGPAVDVRSGDLIICGSGSFEIKNTKTSENASTAMAVRWTQNITDAHIVIKESANVKVETAYANAIDINTSAASSLTVQDSATLTVKSASASALNMATLNPALRVKDKANAVMESGGDAVVVNLDASGSTVTAAVPTKSSTLEVAGEGRLEIKGGSIAASFGGSNDTGYVASVIVKDSAYLKSTSLNQGLKMVGNCAGGKTVVKVTDNANMDVVVGSSTTKYGQALDLRGNKVIDVDITTTGTVNLTSTASFGWGSSPISVSPSSGCDIDFYIKDAKVNVTNNGNGTGPVTVATYLNFAQDSSGQNGQFVLDGNAVFTTKATDAASTYNRACGIFITNADVTVKGNAKLIADSVGTKSASTGAAIGMKVGNLNVEGNGQVIATANGTCSAVLFSENTDVITVKENGTLTLTGTGIPAIGQRHASSNTTINVNDHGKITATGSSAVVWRDDATNAVNAMTVGELSSAEAIFVANLKVPANVRFDSITDTSATVVWDADSAATGYDVYLDGADTPIQVDTNSYTITGLTTATAHTVQVVARHDYGSTDKSAVASFVTKMVAPSSVSVTSVTDTKATVSWSAVTGATGYEVWLNGNKVDTVDTTSYSLTELTAATAYTVKIVALNENNPGDSVEVSKEFTSGTAGLAANVVITLDDGSKVHMNSTKTVLNPTAGTVTFDPATGTLTLNGVSGVKRIDSTSGLLTVSLVGENTVNNGTETNHALWGTEGLVINGTGTLHLEAKAYPLGVAKGELTVDGVKVTVKAHYGTAVHTQSAGGDHVVSVLDDAELIVTNVTGWSIDIKGDKNVTFTVDDTAKVSTTTANGCGINMQATDSATLNILGKAQVSVNNTKGECVNLTANRPTVNVGDEAVVSLATASGAGVVTTGLVSSVNIKDKASVTVSPTGNAFNLAVASTALPSGITATSGAFNLSGEAKVNIPKGNVALYVNVRKDTNHTSSVTIKNSAQFTSVTGGQGIVVNASESGTNKAILAITDTAVVDIDVSAGNGSYGQAIDIRGGSNGSDVDITTTKTVTVNTSASGWSGAVLFRGSGTHDILIRDTNLNITNTAKTLADAKVWIGFCANSKSNITVEGNAVITSNVINNSPQANRSHALYLNNGSVLTIKDNASVTGTQSGSAPADSWLHATAGLYVQASSVVVTDNAQLTVDVSATAKTPAVVFQRGACSFTASGNATVNLKSSNSVALDRVGDVSPFALAVTDSAKIHAQGAAGAAMGFASADTLNFDSSDVLTATDVYLVPVLEVPTNVAVNDITASSATVTWDAVFGATGYDVYVNDATTPVSITSNACALTDLSSGTVYTVKVVAVNAYVESEKSQAASFYTNMAAPANVAENSVTQVGAAVTWDAVVGATGYNVYCKAPSDQDFTKLTASPITETSFALTDLAANTEYTVKVEAVNANNNNETVSSTDTFTTARLTKPANVNTSDISMTGATVTWDAVLGATGYKLYYKVATAADYTEVTDITTNSYTLSGFNSDTEYSVYVVAVAANDTSANSDVKNFTTAKIETPTNVKVTEITVSSAKVTWDAVPGATGYSVQINGADPVNITGETSYTFTGLASGTAYSVQVTASNATDTSGKSDAATFTTKMVKPANVKAEGVTATGATVTWDAVTGATGYDVYVNDAATPIRVTSNTCTLTDLASGTAYTVKVVAVNADDTTEKSDAATFTTKMVKPANVKAEGVTATGATVTWDAVTGATGYDVYVNDAATPIRVTSNTCTLTDLASGTAYIVKVVAVNADDTTEKSDAVNFNTLVAAPGNVKVSDVAATGAKVTWDASTGATGYDVYVNGQKVATVTGTSCDLTGLTAQTAYAVTVVPAGVAPTAENTAVNFTTIKVPETSDAVLPVAAIALAVSALACAAVVVLRKKAND